MLFSSYVFILAFLPVAVLGYWWIQQRRGLTMALSWLTACSLFFYGWWNPAYLALIIGLMLFNFFVGKWILKSAF